MRLILRGKLSHRRFSKNNNKFSKSSNSWSNNRVSKSSSNSKLGKCRIKTCLLYFLVAVTLLGITFGKQKLGVILKYNKQDVIDFTKISKMTMCRASEAWKIDSVKNQVPNINIIHWKSSSKHVKNTQILWTVAKTCPFIPKNYFFKNLKKKLASFYVTF